MSIAVRAAVAVIGAGVAASVALSVIRTVVLPRAVPLRLPRLVFGATRPVFLLLARLRRRPDDVLALYAPVSLLLLPAVWLSLLGLGYAVIYGALTRLGWQQSIRASGSALLTLGFAQPEGFASALVAFSEAMIGIAILALVITYLPAIYGAFQRRESTVALVEVRAGPPPSESPGPPSAVQLLWRFHVLGWMDHLDEQWTEWERWFLDIEESHSSLSVLVHFRSAYPWRSWVNAAGTLLDGAALRNSAVDRPREPRAEFLIRAGFITLRRLCDTFRISYDPDPKPGDAIAVTREEFDDAVARLEDAGLPMRADRDAAWRDFAGWRVNYDVPLRALTALTLAPQSPWVGDRPLSLGKATGGRSGSVRRG